MKMNTTDLKKCINDREEWNVCPHVYMKTHFGRSYQVVHPEVHSHSTRSLFNLWVGLSVCEITSEPVKVSPPAAWGYRRPGIWDGC